VLEEYHRKYAHRRKAWVYYITATITEFLGSINIDEGWPVNGLDKGHFKVYKSFLMEGRLAPRHRRKPGAVTIARKLATLHHFVKYCLANDYLDSDIMAGLALPPRLVAAARVQKEGFTDEELSSIFQRLTSNGFYPVSTDS